MTPRQEEDVELVELQEVTIVPRAHIHGNLLRTPEAHADQDDLITQEPSAISHHPATTDLSQISSEHLGFGMPQGGGTNTHVIYKDDHGREDHFNISVGNDGNTVTTRVPPSQGFL